MNPRLGLALFILLLVLLLLLRLLGDEDGGDVAIVGAVTILLTLILLVALELNVLECSFPSLPRSCGILGGGTGSDGGKGGGGHGTGTGGAGGGSLTDDDVDDEGRFVCGAALETGGGMEEGFESLMLVLAPGIGPL